MPCPGWVFDYHLHVLNWFEQCLCFFLSPEEKAWDKIRAERQEVNMHSHSRSYWIFYNNFRTQYICIMCNSARCSHAQVLSRTCKCGHTRICTWALNGYLCGIYYTLGTGCVYIMPDCLGRWFIKEEVKCITSKDRWPGFWVQFPSCVNLAKSVRLKFFSCHYCSIREFIHTFLQV